jgi:hypothetical protein
MTDSNKPSANKTDSNASTDTSRLDTIRTAYSQTVRLATSDRMQRLMEALHEGRWLVVTAMAMVSLLVVAIPEVTLIQEELVIFFVVVALMVMGYKPEDAFERATGEMTEAEMREAINRQVQDILEDMQREARYREEHLESKPEGASHLEAEVEANEAEASDREYEI